MSRASKFSESVRRRVQKLHKEGKTHEQIRALLNRGGVKGPSIGWINAACRAPAPAEVAPPAPKPRSAPPPPPAEVDDEEGEDAPAGDVRDLLRQQLRVLKRMAKKADKDDNLAGFDKVSRLMNATTTLVAKLEPPPPVDLNTAPDMIEAANRGRALLHGLLDRALKEAGVA